MTPAQLRACIITILLVVSPLLFACNTAEAVSPGISLSALDGISLGNTSDNQVPLKVSYAKNLGLTLNDADLGLIIGSTYSHQETYLTIDKIGDTNNLTYFHLNASYQIVSHTDIGFTMSLPMEGNYSVNDDLSSAARDARSVTGQIEFRMAMFSDAGLVLRKSDDSISNLSGHLALKCELAVRGSNLPVAVFYGDYTNLTYQNVNGSMRSMANLSYSLVIDPLVIHSSGNGSDLAANASVGMDLTGFIDAKGIPQNIEDELFGKTLASYGILSLPVRFEDISYLMRAINHYSIGNETIPIEMAVSVPGSTSDGSNMTVLTLGGLNSTLSFSTKSGKIVGMSLQNPWRGSVSSIGMSMESWNLGQCTYKEAEAGMNLTRGMMNTMPSSIFAKDPVSNVTKVVVDSEEPSIFDLTWILSIVIVIALLSVSVLVYKRKR